MREASSYALTAMRTGMSNPLMGGLLGSGRRRLTGRGREYALAVASGAMDFTRPGLQDTRALDCSALAICEIRGLDLEQSWGLR